MEIHPPSCPSPGSQTTGSPTLATQGPANLILRLKTLLVKKMILRFGLRAN